MLLVFLKICFLFSQNTFDTLLPCLWPGQVHPKRLRGNFEGTKLGQMAMGEDNDSLLDLHQKGEGHNKGAEDRF